MFFEISSIKNFSISTGKHLCCGFNLKKLQAFRHATFLKRDSNSGVSRGYFEMIKSSFLIESLRYLLSAGVFVVWFCVFMCFWIWLKTYTKHCASNSLLSRDKTISFLLGLIYHVLSISEYFGKSLVAFDFDKTNKQECNITCQKTFFACTLQLINFRIWFGKRKNAV